MKQLRQPIIPPRGARPEKAIELLAQSVSVLYSWLAEFVNEYLGRVGTIGRRAHTSEMPDKRGQNTDHDARYARLDLGNFAAWSELTIDSGIISVAAPFHTVDTEGDAASDNLDTINASTGTAMIFLKNEDSGRDVVLKHGAGNIVTRDGSDRTLTGAAALAVLVWDGALWHVVNAW